MFINTILFLFAAELVLVPLYQPETNVTFVRVGAVRPDSVKLHVRYPQANATEGIVYVRYRPISGEGGTQQKWMSGPSISVTAMDDWIGSATLSNLWPSTKYECESFLPYFVLQKNVIFVIQMIL